MGCGCLKAAPETCAHACTCTHTYKHGNTYACMLNRINMDASMGVSICSRVVINSNIQNRLSRAPYDIQVYGLILDAISQ